MAPLSMTVKVISAVQNLAESCIPENIARISYNV